MLLFSFQLSSNIINKNCDFPLFTFENEFNAFSDEVLAYQNNQSIYGTYRTVDVLKKEARDILTQAQSYYDSMNGTENE